jgi:hypothetical protein
MRLARRLLPGNHGQRSIVGVERDAAEGVGSHDAALSASLGSCKKQAATGRRRSATVSAHAVPAFPSAAAFSRASPYRLTLTVRDFSKIEV